ncbi:ABC transporter substrate-binding protein [Nostocoides sp. HKS02]|uniref:ABC transporter substrate-binding protein n=1 Tax=Nostocoides sp. HKS02 TaxID=1813880 RepID=UPI0012B4B0D4|nr:ABC transporter substrate-binding protein [Tetrasphaera sp. HKS02]QGN57720.1 extracellular solute-binding protein [Tetrasphaera sp. HKS02]
MTPSNSRRVIAAALPVLLGAVVAGCSSSNGSAANAAEPQSITFSYQIANPNAKSTYQTLAEQYVASHKGVTIKTNPINLASYNQTLTTQLTAGSGPDVFFINAGSGQTASVEPLQKANKLLDISANIDPKFIPENAKSLFVFNGKTFAVPVYLAPAGLIYNDVAAKQAGVVLTGTSTMDDLIAQCGKARDKGKALLALAGSMSPNTGIFTTAIAASTVYGAEPDWNAKRKAGQVKFATSAGWRTALETVKKLYDQKCFQDGAAGAGFDALTNGMGQGKVFGFAAPGGAAKDIMDSTHGAVKLVVLPMPGAGVDTYLMAGTPDAVAGNAKTKSPKLVKDFLSWMTQPAQAKTAAEAAGDLPVGAIDTSAVLPQYDGIKSILDAKHIANYPQLDWPNGEVYDTLGSGVTGLLTGQKSVDDVLNDLDKAWG